MFFWGKITYKKIKNKKIKASLQTRHKHTNPEISDNILNPNENPPKRTFSFSPPFVEGSLCVEAAFSFTFFLIFFANILSLLFLFISYMKQLEKLQERAKTMAIYSYSLNNFNLSEELIRLTDRVTVQTPFTLFHFGEKEIGINCVVKPWTGYQAGIGVGEDLGEEIVYMTEQGSVFHRDRGCTHLSVSLQLISGKDRRIKESQYTPCEHCFAGVGKSDNFNLALYITDHGDRYHRTINCKSLKRTVKSIPLSQVKGIPECTKCR